MCGCRSEVRMGDSHKYSSGNDFGFQKTIKIKKTCDEDGLPILKCLICCACGIAFGVAMHKGTVTDPNVIQQQMIFKEFTMLKFFLSALATSMFAMSLVAMLPQTSKFFNLASNDYFNKMADRSFKSSIVGGLIMGTGMTISGSCPTSIFPQIGALVPNSGFILLGAFSAVILFCMYKPQLDSVFQSCISESKNPWSHSPYFTLSLPIMAMFGILVCAFETLLPFHVNSSIPASRFKSGSLIVSYPWPPYVSGILVGILQIPLIISVQKTLSGSSSLIVVASQIFVGPLKKFSQVAQKYQSGLNNWWQVFYVTGAIVGGFLSAFASGSLGVGHEINPIQGFVGGFLLTMGARIGGGCTSNHGLTGMGLLSILSFVMIASTFASAIFVAFVLKFSGLL